jgi:5,10-methylenetetrahydromethanopterin reductase
MDISIWGNHDATSVNEVVQRVAAAYEDGFRSIWFPQTWTFDTLTALAVAAREVPAIHLGVAVIPIQGRHPIPLAQQALTVADIAGPARVTLGIGVTYAAVSEGRYGIPYSTVVSLCSEELQALGGLLSPARSAEIAGELVTARATLAFDAPSPGLVVGALGPKMLQLAGKFSDGTVTWLTGTKAVAELIVPVVRAAAASAGRPAPRVIVGLPVCVTDDIEGTRSSVGASLVEGLARPSYRRMFAAEGVPEPVDIAFIGDETRVATRIEELAKAGATEFLADVRGNASERRRTRRFLSEVAGH